jgi:large subunit ribosomal protein L3
MPKTKRPRRGSLAFYPKKRARRIYPRIKTYPKIEKPKVLAFAAYKAGMRSVVLIDNDKNSPTYGQEISVPITVLDAPPLFVAGIRAYIQTVKGLRTFTEVWNKKLPKGIERVVKIKKINEKNLEKIEKNLEKIKEIRLIVCTQPKLSGLGKKTPEVLEVPLGGEIKEKFELAKSLLGKEISIDKVFSKGEIVDVIAVTKGKGTAGPVRRFGIKIQTRKAHKKRRHVGAIGTQVPRKVLWTVPMAGQLGFQTRTEFNKKILSIEEGEKVTPKSGFNRYGVIKQKAVLLEGSVPGPVKRLIILRAAMRPKVRVLPVEIKKIL